MVTYLSGGRIQGSSAPLGNISKADLKAYFTLDETSGDLANTALAIGSSSSDALTDFNLSTTTATRNQTGKVNKALSFSGSSHIATANISALADTIFLSSVAGGAVVKWTMCFWVKLDTRVGDQAFICTTDSGSGDNGLLIRTSDTSGHLNIIFGTNGDDRIEATSDDAAIPDTGNWHFVMYQFDNSTGNIKMSVDNGTVETVDHDSGTTIDNTDTPSDKFVIGNQVGGGNGLAGDLDEISVWNRILTTDEITKIYLANNSGDNLSTVQTAGADEKVAITDVPAGTRYEETDTRKTFRYGTDLVDGTGLKAYYKFDESSGNIINQAVDVTDNDTLPAANTIITLAGTGQDVYGETAPSGLGTGSIEFPATSNESGRYGTLGLGATNTLSQWNFLHNNTGGGTPKWTVCYWSKYDSMPLNNSNIIRNVGGDATSGLTIYHYGQNTSGDGAIVVILSNEEGQHQPLTQADVQTAGFIPSDGDWHFYTYTMDWSLSSANLKMHRDMGTSSPAYLTRTKNTSSSSNNPSTDEDADYPMAFRHNATGNETYIPTTQTFAELSIWSRVLTDDELTKIYNSGAGMDLITGVDVWKEKGTA